MTMLPTISAVLLFSCVSATAVETAVETAEAAAEAIFDVSMTGAFAVSDRLGYIFLLLRARRNEKELKVKPATSFKYFQYLLTKI